MSSCFDDFSVSAFNLCALSAVEKKRNRVELAMEKKRGSNVGFIALNALYSLKWNAMQWLSEHLSRIHKFLALLYLNISVDVFFFPFATFSENIMPAKCVRFFNVDVVITTKKKCDGEIIYKSSFLHLCEGNCICSNNNKQHYNNDQRLCSMVT